MRTTMPGAGFKPVRRDQLRTERIHDTYQLTRKPPEPSVCRGCGVVFSQGRWQWKVAPEGAHSLLCPACARVRDHLPAGFVTLAGDYFKERRDEILRLVRHHEEKEKAEHPLARVMAIEEQEEGVLITTTDIHLAREIGEAVYKAHAGELEYHYNEGERLLRVEWRR
ncbi:MAG: BCAM0308 family protein [Rhodocyclaceae bacterium]|nr:BCAM0308 family protein [Rhodocyclaceae bacterium]